MFQVWIGVVVEKGLESQVGFLNDSTVDSVCAYTTIVADRSSVYPCGRPFILADGLQYVWTGCGLDTAVSWRNPADAGSQFQVLGNCTYAPHTFACPSNKTVNAGWLCPNSTIMISR